MADSAKVEDERPADVEVAPLDAQADGKAEVAAESEPPADASTAAEENGPSIARPPKNMLRVKRTDDDGSARRNKFDPSSRGESSNPDEIRTQVHFYFSDSNLPTDSYMQELTGGAENKPVPLTKITAFKRMHRFKPYESVVAALKESNFLVVEGEEGNETLRRKKAFNPADPKRTKIDEQSVYVKGFGNEEPSTQFDIEAFFTQFGAFNSVRLRRGDDGGFKGSVFVEWTDKETADKFMALEPKPQWKDHDLLIMWKVDYVKEKNDGIKSGTINPSKSFHRGSRKPGHRGGRAGFRGRDGERGGNADRDDWKKRRENDQKNGFNDRRGGRPGRGGRDFKNRREDKQAPAESGDAGAPKINVSGNGASTEAEKANGKRARGDEDAKDEPPAKKVDVKKDEVEAA